MRFGSVCSGIEAASEAWLPLGWTPVFYSEIESFCCSLLKQKHPTVKNYGDFTTIGSDAGSIDVLVGGTPCQDFSVAGLRAGLDGARGNLTLEFVKLAGRLRPRWVVWENVPGVLSIDNGRAFGAFLGGLAELGYGFAYRVRDAQYDGVAQRRRRVFVVGHLGDWRRAAAVLFERDCLSGNPAPRREAGKATAGGAIACLDASFGRLQGASGQDANHGHSHLVTDVAGGRAQERNVLTPTMAVRRLTPLECERLQGFKDGHTAITFRGKPAVDGNRYKALGNSFAVPVVGWIGERIQQVENLKGE